jgi:hypothetical protein
MHAANELSAAQSVVARGRKDETKGDLALRPPEKKLGIASLRAEAEGDLGSQGSAIPTPAPAAIPTPARTQETPIEELLRLKKLVSNIGTGKGFFGGNAGASTAAYAAAMRIAQLEKQMGGAGGVDYVAAMRNPELVPREPGIADYYNQLASERQAAADKKNATKAPTEAKTEVKENITKIPTDAIKQAPPAVQDEYAKRIAELKAKESDKNDRLISFLLGAAGHSSLAGTLAGGAHAGRAHDAQIKQQIMDTQDKITALNLKQQELGIEGRKVDVQALGVDAENARTVQVARTAVLANEAKLREMAVQAGYDGNKMERESLNKFAETISKSLLENPMVMGQIQAINKQLANGKIQPTDAYTAVQSIMNTAMGQAMAARNTALGDSNPNPFMSPSSTSSTSIRPDNK